MEANEPATTTTADESARVDVTAADMALSQLATRIGQTTEGIKATPPLGKSPFLDHGATQSGNGRVLEYVPKDGHMATEQSEAEKLVAQLKEKGARLREQEGRLIRVKLAGKSIGDFIAALSKLPDTTTLSSIVAVRVDPTDGKLMFETDPNGKALT